MPSNGSMLRSTLALSNARRPVGSGRGPQRARSSNGIRSKKTWLRSGRSSCQAAANLDGSLHWRSDGRT